MSFYSGPVSTTTHQPIIVRTSKLKLLLPIAACLAFVLLSFWMINDPIKPGTHAVGLLSLIFFGLCLLVYLILMCMPSLLLTIDEQGMHYRYPFRRPKDVRWEEIAYIHPISVSTNRRLFASEVTFFTLYVSPVGIPTYLARNGKINKLSASRSQSHTPMKVFSLPMATATISYNQLITQIQEQYGDLLTRYQISIYDA